MPDKNFMYSVGGSVPTAASTVTTWALVALVESLIIVPSKVDAVSVEINFK